MADSKETMAIQAKIDAIVEKAERTKAKRNKRPKAKNNNTSRDAALVLSAAAAAANAPAAPAGPLPAPLPHAQRPADAFGQRPPPPSIRGAGYQQQQHHHQPAIEHTQLVWAVVAVGGRMAGGVGLYEPFGPLGSVRNWDRVAALMSTLCPGAAYTGAQISNIWYNEIVPSMEALG